MMVAGIVRRVASMAMAFGAAKEFERSIGRRIADRIQECGGIINCNWESFCSGK